MGRCHWFVAVAAFGCWSLAAPLSAQIQTAGELLVDLNASDASAGSPVWVRDRQGQIEVHYGSQQIAVHRRASGRHQIVTVPQHHQGIPLGSQGRSKKILIHLQQVAPEVEVRPLAAYESVAGGAR